MIDKTRKGARKKASRAQGEPATNPTPTHADRLARLEEIIDLLLGASLRGHLLPSERKLVKQYLKNRKLSRSNKTLKQAQDSRCPVCRLPLVRPRVKRCPWCAVLLVEARKGLKQASKKR